MSQPTLYLMLGYPGAGKTTAAQEIAGLTGAVHLASDRIRLELFPDPMFSESEHKTLYDELDNRVKQLLSEGKSVVYDANLNRFEHRQEKYDIAEQADAVPKLVWVQTKRDVAKQRASDKSRMMLWRADEGPEAMFDRLVNVFEEPHSDEPYIAMDGTKITSDYVRHALGL